jgi:uncharacterized protein (TIGR02147 family)
MRKKTKPWDPAFQARLLEAQDFKAFLRLFFRSSTAEKDDSTRHPKPITYAEFSRRAGFSSRSYILDVLEGRKPLGSAVMEKIARGLGLTSLWREYFRLLLAHSKSSDSETFQRNLDSIRKKLSKRSRISLIPPGKNQSKFSPLIRTELPRIYAACGSEIDGASLAEVLARTRGEVEITESVLQKLESLGLLEKKGDRYYPRYAHLAFERFESENFFREDYLANLEVAKKRLDSGARLRRSSLFFSSTVCVKHSRMGEFSDRLRDLLHDFVSDVEASDGDCIADIVLGFSDNSED